MKKRLGTLLLAVMMVMMASLLTGCGEKDASREAEKVTQPEGSGQVTQPEESKKDTQPAATEKGTQPEKSESVTQPKKTEKATQPEKSETATRPEEPEITTLVGTWEIVDTEDAEQNAELEEASAFLSFSEDGLWKFWYEVKIDGEIIEDNSGTYSTAGDTLTMRNVFDIELGTQTDSTYKISGTTLTITTAYDDGTECLRLTRVD